MSKEEVLRTIALSLYENESVTVETLSRLLEAAGGGGDLEARVAALEKINGKELAVEILSDCAKVLNSAVSEYFTITVAEGTGAITVAVQDAQKGTLVSAVKTALAAKTLSTYSELKKSVGNLKKVAISGTEIDLTKDSIDIAEITAFLKKGLAGITGQSQLSELNSKSFTLDVTDGNDQTYNYTVSFTSPA